MSRISALVAVTLTGLMLSLTAEAQVDASRVVAVQGAVYTSSGTPANGDFALTLGLFAAETGGAALYSQVVDPVTVAGGLFDVELGPIPTGVFEGADVLWLETKVDGETLPRRPVRPVAYALVARQATTALSAADLDCSGCVKASHVGFPWALATTPGGAAVDVECVGCIAATDIGAGAIATTHIQSGAVTTDKAGFNYAGSTSKGGAATDLACSGCVGSGDLAPTIGVGQLTVDGAVYACAAGAPGCAVFVEQSALTNNAGALAVQASGGLQVRTLDGSAWAPAKMGASTVYGALEIVGAGLSAAGDVTSTGGQVLAASGSQAKPGHSFVGDTDTGIYASAANQLSFAAGGATPVTITASGVRIGGSSGAPDPSAALDVAATAGGFLPPRLSAAQRNAIQNPAAGLQVMNTSSGCLEIWFAGAGWRELACQCTSSPSSAFTAPSGIGVGGPAAFSATQAGLTYLWTFQGGNPATSTAKDPTTTWSSAGTYAVTLKVTDGAGCSSSTGTSVNVTSCGTIGSNTQTFAYSGSVAQWVVPGGVCKVRIEVWGAQGGDPSTGRAGRGGYAKGELDVTAGETLYVYVGGQGTTTAGGWNGGGGPGGSTVEFGGGGGASDVRQGGTSLNQRVIVAGGGGGAGSTCPSAAGTTAGNGGGLTGGSPSGSCNSGNQPTPGTPSAGGQPGGYSCNFYCGPGSFGQGGQAGGSCGCGAVGGGGGGWYGGGGACHCKAAAGGSSYIGGVSNGSTSAGGRSGHGQVVLTW